MYTVYCSHSRYDEICYALTKLDIEEMVYIEAVEWLPHSEVLVKLGAEVQRWGVEPAQLQSGSLN